MAASAGRSSVKYIFCITTGRSGTEYLSSLFYCARDVLSQHEPSPVCNGGQMQLFNLDLGEACEHPMLVLTQEKLNTITQKLQQKRKKIYFEANHQFIKGFG